MNFYFIFGHKRSGHHAIIYWLSHQLNQSSIFYNDCVISNSNDTYIMEKIGSFYSILHKEEDETVEYEKIKSFLFFDKIKEINNINNIFYNFESQPLESLQECWIPQLPLVRSHLSDKNIFHFIIINRDPYNWLASSIRGLLVHGEQFISNSIDIWKQYIYKSLGYSKYNRYKFIDISYNEWFKNNQYRKNICKNFDSKFSDLGLKNISIYGGGSSFDKVRQCGNAQEMDVLNRWKYYVSDSSYWRFIDAEMEELSKKYFGFYIDRCSKELIKI